MEPEVAVVGAGIVGLCTARALGRRGASVRVYERGVPGRGQSAGESRLFRHGHDDPRMVAMAKRSRGIWHEWAESFGTELVSADGVIALGEAALERLEVLASVGGVAARRIDPPEIAERLPPLAAYEGPAVLDEDGGAIRTTAAIEALTGALGDWLVAEEVISLRPVGDRVEVRSVCERATFDRVIVCAGRGTAPLAHTAGVSLPVSLAAHLRATFDLAGPAPSRLACLQDSSGRFPETGVYAAPEPGNRRYAVGLSETLPVSEDGGIVDPELLAQLEDRTTAYVREALPGLDPDPARLVHCWVTEVPWSEDGVGAWEHEGMIFTAGHNLFKLAPALGADLAAAALEGQIPADLLAGSRLGEPQEP